MLLSSLVAYFAVLAELPDMQFLHWLVAVRRMEASSCLALVSQQGTVQVAEGKAAILCSSSQIPAFSAADAAAVQVHAGLSPYYIVAHAMGLSFCCLQDTVIEEDKEFVTQYFDMPDTDFADMERMSPWLLRIELNREMLTDKGLNMSRIADTITSEFGEEMSVIFTDDNAPKHILRVSPFFQHRSIV